MGLLSRKIEPKVEDVSTIKEDLSQDEINKLKESLLSREEVRIYLACKEGERLFNLASKL